MLVDFPNSSLPGKLRKGSEMMEHYPQGRHRQEHPGEQEHVKVSPSFVRSNLWPGAIVLAADATTDAD